VSQVVIENPIMNSPFDEPSRHFKFTNEGITDEEVAGRRVSSYFVPIAPSKKRNGAGKQGVFDTEWTRDRIEINKLVNDIRLRVVVWRKGGYIGVTPTTGRLIAYWTDPNSEKKLFFCQNEALQTAIYIVEVAKKYGDAWIENAIREANDTSNPDLPRMALKMATGTGKTVVIKSAAISAAFAFVTALGEFCSPASKTYCFGHPSPYPEARSICRKEYGRNRFSGTRLIPVVQSTVDTINVIVKRKGRPPGENADQLPLVIKVR
jgi:hypothetical protein